jgi:hypothetical protein
MGGPYCSTAFSTIVMARSTPAQKPRGLAKTSSKCSGAEFIDPGGKLQFVGNSLDTVEINVKL